MLCLRNVNNKLGESYDKTAYEKDTLRSSIVEAVQKEERNEVNLHLN
jgi:hypothetical protein